jgi:hypothetical protein
MEINISFVAVTLSLTLIFIFGWYSYKAEPKIEIPDISRFPFNQSTGKERSFVNKTSDASLWIEGTRRKVIAKAYKPDWCCGVTKTIKETQYTTGSTSGVVEAYFLSAFGRICPDPCEEIIYSGDGGECLIDGNVSVGCPEECTEVIYADNGDGPILAGSGTVILEGSALCCTRPEECTEVIYADNDDGPVLAGSGTVILEGNE